MPSDRPTVSMCMKPGTCGHGQPLTVMTFHLADIARLQISILHFPHFLTVARTEYSRGLHNREELVSAQSHVSEQMKHVIFKSPSLLRASKFLVTVPAVLQGFLVTEVSSFPKSVGIFIGNLLVYQSCASEGL